MTRKTRTNDGNKKGGSPEWMATYADMVTLLLCFFVLLFAMSEVEASKFEAFIQSFQGSLGVLDSGRTIESRDLVSEGSLHDMSEMQIQELEILIELETMATDLREHLQGEGLNEQVSIEHNERYVKLNFLDGVLFDPGLAVLKDEAIEVLDAVGIKLLEYTDNRIRIEGHTDTVPINTIQYPNNWYLSAARAIAVAEYYIYEKGFEPRRLSAEGFGEYTPIATNETAEGRARNRRVEIKILNSVESARIFSEEENERVFHGE